MYKQPFPFLYFPNPSKESWERSHIRYKVKAFFRGEKPQINQANQTYSNLFHIFNPIFDLVGCTYVFIFSNFQNSARFHHREFCFVWTRSEKPIVLGPPEFENRLNRNLICLMPGSFPIFDFFGCLRC